MGVYADGGLQLGIFENFVLAQNSPPRHLWGSKWVETTQNFTRSPKTTSEFPKQLNVSKKNKFCENLYVDSSAWPDL